MLELTTKEVKDNVLYFHGKTIDYVGCGKSYRYTIAAEYTSNGLIMGISICSPTDQFVKKIGREKAYERMILRKLSPVGINKGSAALIGLHIPEGNQIKFFNQYAASFKVLTKDFLMMLFNISNKK